MTKNIILYLCLFISFIANAQKDSVTAFVYHDANQNQVFDQGDQELANILISSLHQITPSNEKGIALIPIKKKDIVYVIKPDGYQSPIKSNQCPDFYKICYQKSSNKKLKYQGIEKDVIPDTIFFPLFAETKKDNIKGHMIGDIQTPTYSHVKYFRQLIMPSIINSDADFGVCLGDIADDRLDLYADIEDALSTSNMPLYMVCGNHDINYVSKNNSNKAETFRSHFGPDYYSFNYGNNHCIVLNNVDYHGWNKKKDKKGSYSGGFDEKQIQWLKQDLSYMEDEQRVVLLSHIPLLKDFCDSTQLLQLFELFASRKDIVAIAGHTHSNINWDFNAKSLWNYAGQFKGHAAGASCGAWWVSPMGPDSLPDATCNDGIPAGTFIYTFEQDQFSKDFVAGTNYATQQLRISAPYLFVEQDSLSDKAIYVNVFDGDTHAKVSCQINNGESLSMEKVNEIDPFVARNQYRRKTYDGWTPWIFPSDHLWKAAYPKNLKIGMHQIKAKCTLANGKNYETTIVFEVK